jgi:hypothetical protein
MHDTAALSYRRSASTNTFINRPIAWVSWPVPFAASAAGTPAVIAARNVLRPAIILALIRELIVSRSA